MIFLNGHILGFGKFTDFTFDFDAGINVVVAPNEGGKSTLQHFLTGLLYGQHRSNLKTQKRLDAWVERYEPWYGRQYGGMLRCRLADNRELEIRRIFGKDDGRIEIRTSAGEDITRQYDRQRNGDILFGKYHFGMPKDLYESLGVIRENRAAEMQNRETIRDRIANLAYSGNEDLSIRQSLAKLQEQIDAIGSERARTKPFKRAKDLVRTLQKEHKDLTERRERFQQWLQERNRLADEVRLLERELVRTGGLLISAKRRDIAARIRSMEDIDEEIALVKKTIESLNVREDFPLESLEELNRLAGARDSITKQLDGVRAEKEASIARLDRAEKDRLQLRAYARLAGSEEPEKITEWFVGYLSLSLQKDGLKKTTGRLQSEVEVLERKLADTSPALREGEIDWDSFAREAAEDERIAAGKCSELAADAAKEKMKLAEAVRTAFNRRLGAFLLFVLAGVPAAWRYYAQPGSMPGWLELGLGGGCLALSAWMWFAAAGVSRSGRAAEQQARELEIEQAETREKGGVKRAELDKAVANSGFRGLDEFLKASRRIDQARTKLADLLSRLEEAERQSRHQQERSDEMFHLLQESLEKAGLSCSAGNLKSQVDVLRNNLRRFRELDARFNQCKQNVDSLKTEETALERERARKVSRIRALLETAGVDTPEQFKEECSKKRRSMELLDREASRSREFGRLAGERTLGQWKESLRRIEVQEQSLVSDGVEEGAAPSAPYLPYLPSVPELEEKERSLMSRLSDARQEHTQVIEQVRHAFQNLRPSSEIDEDLVAAESEFRELERNRSALEIALDTIETLSRRQQEVLAPQLNNAVQRRFTRLCAGRYSEVKIDPDFRVLARETDTGELRSAESLSRGTQDQLYFAIRFGILDLVSNGNDPCPCLLDEPFAAYDRPRLLEAYGILDEEALNRQLVLFTCREDLTEIASAKGANIIRLE